MRTWLLLLVALATLAKSETCSEKDIGRAYTPCINNKKQAVYFYITACTPSASFPLPDTVYDIPCDIECDVGEHLPFGSISSGNCIECEPGSFSPGGELYNSWDSMPETFRTDCVADEGNCSSWVVKGDYIDSGDNFNYINIDSNLRMHSEFKRETGNKILFLYRVDAEKCASCDGLKFYVDDEVEMELVSQQLRWTLYELEVTKGYHDFRWTFKKDSSISRGADKASIMMIETVGTYKYIEDCLKCPSGTFSSGLKNFECQKCDYNTYSEPGKGQCTSCVTGYASFQGSAACTKLPKCDETMYFGKRTECDSVALTQNLVYEFFTMGNGQVKICDENDPFSSRLPSTLIGTPCTCPPGQYLTNDGKCEFCQLGYARGIQDSVCRKCPGGTAAIKTLFFGEWSKIPVEFENFCEGHCDAAGWVPRGFHVDAGYGSAKEMEAVMTIKNVVLETTGYFEVEYSLISCGEDCKFEIVIDGTLEDAIYVGLNSTSGHLQVFTNPLAPGTYTFSFRYYQLKAAEIKGGKAKISRISFVGVSKGGAVECTPCPAGYDSSDDGSNECKPCTKGYYSSSSGDRCKLADDGYYVDIEGATSQTPCGPGTRSFDNRTDCHSDCIFTVSVSSSKKVVYDLNPLYNPEKMHFAGNDRNNTHVFFLNLCSRKHLNSTCFDRTGNPIPTFGCQDIKNWGHAVDIGHVIGFRKLEDSPTHGLIVALSEGSPGCENYYGTPTPRRTNITLICNPEAGIGTPDAPETTDIEYPPKSCIYNFVWESQHACPLCIESDFEFSESSCIDNKKTVTKVRIGSCYDKYPTQPQTQDCVSCPATSIGICNKQGSCDDKLGNCHCSTRWSGELCDKCSLGYFGEQCLQDCPGGGSNPCNGHGYCFYGLTGNGTCSCSTGWTGASCDTCDEGFDGENCDAKPAKILDVVPWWGFILIFGSVIVIGAGLFLLWRSKRKAEYKYTSLLKSQPVELEGEDNGIGLPLDEEEDQARN